MSIGRVILGLAAGAAGWLLTRQLKKLQNGRSNPFGDGTPHHPSPHSSSHASRDSEANAPQAMVACAHCGLHIPANDAVRRAGNVFCCPEHAAQHD